MILRSGPEGKAARHIAWKRRIGRILRRFATRRPRAVVLIYHAIGSGPASLPLERFQEQIAWMVRHASVVTVDELLAGEEPSGLRVAVTFDDGYSCVARTAAPVVFRAGLPAAVFLNTASIGESLPIESDANKGHIAGEEFLVWKEVDTLFKAGWTIGSHGADHVDLTRLPDAEVRTQLRQSKAAVEAHLGTQCRHFAYTWGNHNARVRAAVAECGYDLAVAGVHGAVLPSSDRYAIPRIDIRSDYELEDFIAVVRGDWDYLGLVQRARRLFR